LIKELCLFSGYGGSVFALKKAGIEHTVIGYSDIDKNAKKIFALNHGEHIPAIGDITKINAESLLDFDLLTGGFPCQDVSVVGNRDLLNGRTTLFKEIIRIAEVKKPRWMLLENVKGLLSTPYFYYVLSELKKIGYKVNWKVLNSKDYGIPQNRERVWFACFREKTDADKFLFPEKEKMTLKFKDILETNVPEKYYLTELQIKKMYEREQMLKYKNLNFYSCFIPLNINKNCSTLCARDYKDGSKKICEPSILDNGYSTRRIPREYHNYSPCLHSKTHNFLTKNLMNCLTETQGQQRSSEELSSDCITIKSSTGKIRRLMPIECFRLQGFLHDEIKLGGLSDSALYKLAGNGWEICVVSKIFEQMFKGNKNKQRGFSDFK
jgi:DNA-cytosine methyltransferase